MASIDYTIPPTPLPVYTGCGTGNYALSLSPYVKEIIGIDINTKMIEEANKKNIKNLRIIQGDITKLDQLLPKECCDVAICTVVSNCRLLQA